MIPDHQMLGAPELREYLGSAVVVSFVLEVPNDENDNVKNKVAISVLIALLLGFAGCNGDIVLVCFALRGKKGELEIGDTLVDEVEADLPNVQVDQLPRTPQERRRMITHDLYAETNPAWITYVLTSFSAGSWKRTALAATEAENMRPTCRHIIMTDNPALSDASEASPLWNATFQ